MFLTDAELEQLLDGETPETRGDLRGVAGLVAELRADVAAPAPRPDLAGLLAGGAFPHPTRTVGLVARRTGFGLLVKIVAGAAAAAAVLVGAGASHRLPEAPQRLFDQVVSPAAPQEPRTQGASRPGAPASTSGSASGSVSGSSSASSGGSSRDIVTRRGDTTNAPAGTVQGGGAGRGLQLPAREPGFTDDPDLRATGPTTASDDDGPVESTAHEQDDTERARPGRRRGNPHRPATGTGDSGSSEALQPDDAVRTGLLPPSSDDDDDQGDDDRGRPDRDGRDHEEHGHHGHGQDGDDQGRPWGPDADADADGHDHDRYRSGPDTSGPDQPARPDGDRPRPD